MNSDIKYNNNYVSKLNNLEQSYDTNINNIEKMKNKINEIKNLINSVKLETDDFQNKKKTFQEKLDFFENLNKTKEEKLIEANKINLLKTNDFFNLQTKYNNLKNQNDNNTKYIISINSKIKEIYDLINNNNQLLDYLLKYDINKDNMSGGGCNKSKKNKYFFSNYSHEQLIELAKEWGITDFSKYRNKNDLLLSLKSLFNYKKHIIYGGKSISKKNIDIIAHNIDIKQPNLYNKKQLYDKILYKLRNI